MSRGMTIADFVQQVLYAIYKVRLDVTASADGGQSFHADTDKFKEVVFEANMVLQELQKEQDWNFLRERQELGTADAYLDGAIQEFELGDIYKVCTGYNDAVRAHDPLNYNRFFEIPFTSPRSGTRNRTSMFNQYSQLNTPNLSLQAFVVGNDLTFNRPFALSEHGLLLETDVIRMLEPLHICGPECEQPCPRSYEDLVFTEIPDPYYLVVRTAAKRAEGDPSAVDRVVSLADESLKMLSAMRENDSSKTEPDEYTTVELGYLRVL